MDPPHGMAWVLALGHRPETLGTDLAGARAHSGCKLYSSLSSMKQSHIAVAYS